MASTGDTPAIEGDEELVKSDRYPPVPVDVQVVDGVTLRTEAGPARVVETPGHTPGHVSVVLPDAELLIAGDAMTADENGLRGPDERFTPEMETAVDSVGKLSAFDTNRTLCYHGGFVEDADVAAVYQSLTE